MTYKNIFLFPLLLVLLLTGCATDRLKTEIERGLTIELGFAPCVLQGEVCIGIVDVPGHEKFVRNMVTGVSGIAMTVLVIAADDGVMPQTVEHLQITADPDTDACQLRLTLRLHFGAKGSAATADDTKRKG